MDDAPQHHSFESVKLASGVRVPQLTLAYQSFGTLNSDRSNAVLFPTWFAGQHPANRWIIGPGCPLDPDKYFIVVVNIFGNGMSSSPSNMPPPFDGPRFPLISVLDNVLLQRRFLQDRFGIETLALIIGRSMGGQIAFQWGAAFPDKVAAILSFVGSATTSTYNHLFLDNVALAIRSDQHWNGGDYTSQPLGGLRHMRLVFDSWGLSDGWYRAGHHLAGGFASMAEFLDRPLALDGADANNYLAQIATWRTADIGATPGFGGDYARALNAIRARAIVMPCRTDMYFRFEDSEVEVCHMPNAELRVIDSVWGHRAGSPGSDPRDIAFIEQAIADLLDG